MELRDQNGKTEEEFLKEYHPKDYPSSFLTADLAIYKKIKNEVFLLLIQRKNHPCLGMWALPGGFVNPDENAKTAAARELEEETHLVNLSLTPLGLFSNPGRDPRFWVVSQCFMSLIEDDRIVQADDDAREAKWFKVSVEQQEQVFQVKLQAEETIIEYSFCNCAEKTLLGEQAQVEICERGQIAFDHNEMIAYGILKLKEAGIL